VRPLARLATELMTSGVGYIVLGLAGLVGSLARGTSPGRALVPFVVVAAAMALVQTRAGFAWIRRNVEGADPAPAEADEEAGGRTVRRTATSLLIYLVAIVAAVAVGRGLGAIVGGVAAGVGAIELVAARWVTGRERDEGVALLRETPSSPFGSGRRSIYTRPTSASTLAT
jgi:hypothetical protein